MNILMLFMNQTIKPTKKIGNHVLYLILVKNMFADTLIQLCMKFITIVKYSIIKKFTGVKDTESSII